MTLVYGSAASGFFFGLLNNTFTTSITGFHFSRGQPTLPQPVIDASTGRLSYDDLRKQLSFSGVLDAATQTMIANVITVNTIDSTDKVAAGNTTTFTPVAMNNIYPVGAALVIDSGAAQETVIVTATTATTFVATTVHAHDGTVTPFAIVNYPTLVATTDSTDKVAAGNTTTFTPASMNNIYSGAVLVIDSGAAQEAVSVTATTATSFVARRSTRMMATVTPFAIVNYPNACGRDCQPRCRKPAGSQPVLHDLPGTRLALRGLCRLDRSGADQENDVAEQLPSHSQAEA